MAFLHSEGAEIFWDSVGQGPPVLLIMGLSFTHEMWFRTVPALQKSFRVLLFDNRGMGRSSVPNGPYSMARMARDAAAVLDAAGESSAHVVGASMGGMIAQELALRSPGRVRSLALGCTSSSGIFGKWPDFDYMPGPFSWTKTGRVQRERSIVPLLYAKETPIELIEEDLRIRLECNWTYKGFLNQLCGILSWSSLRRLKLLRTPTLVVHGDSDRLIPPANGRVLASRIPEAKFRIVHQAGHILTTDQTEICNSYLLQFLEEQEEQWGLHSEQPMSVLQEQ